MPFEKGHKKAKGRIKGSKNFRVQLLEEIVNKFSMDPLEVLMHFAAGDWKALGYDSDVYHIEKPDGDVKMGYVITPELRLQAAKEATQYLHAKKKEQVEPNNEIEVIGIEDKRKLLEEAKKEISKLEEEIKKINE